MLSNMTKLAKDFFPFDAEVEKIDDEKITLSIEGEKIILSRNLLPKSLEKEKKIKLVLASEISYNNRLEKRAKDILNEIIG